jgi:hypothetical protein
VRPSASSPVRVQAPQLRRIELETGADDAATRARADPVGFVLEACRANAPTNGAGFQEVAIDGLLDREWRDPFVHDGQS